MDFKYVGKIAPYE